MTESETTIQQRLTDIISEQLDMPKEEIHLQSSFKEDLNADSMDIVEIVMECEKEFDLSISDDDAEQLRTVGETVNYISKYQG